MIITSIATRSSAIMGNKRYRVLTKHYIKTMCHLTKFNDSMNCPKTTTVNTLCRCTITVTHHCIKLFNC